MATSWSGFRPQNELIKLYWEALELSQSEKYRFLKTFPPFAGKQGGEKSDDETETIAPLPFIPLR